MKAGRLDKLLDRLCTGDNAAAEEVFRTYEPYLRKVVRRQLPARLRTRFDSVDIVQSIWGDLLDGFRQAGWRFATTAQLQAFLVKVTRNRFIDRCRQHSPALERQECLEDIDPRDLPPSAQPEPSEVAQANDLWKRMLALCPAEHHELLRLKREGKPLPEIAACTGLHVGSVRRILRTLAIRFAREQEA
jgi:RNA polymerase sigma-70 factor (ECF subfamily)